MKKVMHSFNLQSVLDKALSGQVLSMEEIVFLLGLREKQDLNQLFAAARELRTRYFHNKLFLYGFVYFSTWCRNNCNFCYYRKSNQLSLRYRKTKEEILEAAIDLAESGVHLIDLTMGEDPYYFNEPGGFAAFKELVRRIKTLTKLPIMISPGVMPAEALRELAVVGADWYACYQETHNEQIFKQLRPEQSYQRRLLSKRYASKMGLLVEEGLLTGVGESLEDIALSIDSMRILDAHQVRVMSFVPQEGIPMAALFQQARVREFTIIAVLRLLFPDRLIPASLDVDGIEGLQARIEAGANVITSLIPPQMGLAGVAQSTKDINEGARTVQGVLSIIKQMGLEPATVEEYAHWMDWQKYRLRANLREKTGG